MSGLDHGMLNLPLNSRARGKSIERTIADAKAELLAAARVKNERIREQVRADREIEKARTKLTAADLTGATYVQDQFGWHEVVRVNAKTVTVRTGYSWDDRIALSRILKAHPPASP